MGVRDGMGTTEPASPRDAKPILVFGGVLSTGLLLLAVVCAGVIAVFGVGFFAVLGLLSPVWIPLPAVIGVVALRRGGARKAD